jgi:hypothetical protein
MSVALAVVGPVVVVFVVREVEALVAGECGFAGEVEGRISELVELALVAVVSRTRAGGGRAGVCKGTATVAIEAGCRGEGSCRRGFLGRKSKGGVPCSVINNVS